MVSAPLLYIGDNPRFNKRSLWGHLCPHGGREACTRNLSKMRQNLKSRTRIRIPITCFVDYVGDGVIGTGVVQDFSGDGWHITAIEPQPIQVGMSLALRVTLPNQATPITVEAVTVQWVRGREFGVHAVRISSEVAARSDLVNSDRSSK